MIRGRRRGGLGNLAFDMFFGGQIPVIPGGHTAAGHNGPVKRHAGVNRLLGQGIQYILQLGLGGRCEYRIRILWILLGDNAAVLLGQGKLAEDAGLHIVQPERELPSSTAPDPPAAEYSSAVRHPP